MFAGRHIGSGIGQRQRLNPLQDMKPIGAIGCCASAQDNESAGFSDLSNVVTVNWRPEARNLSHGWKAVDSGSLTRPNWPRSQCQRLRSLTVSAPWFVTGHEAHEGVIGCRASAQDDESACTDFTDVSNVVTVNWRPWGAKRLFLVWMTYDSYDLFVCGPGRTGVRSWCSASR